MKVLKSVSEFKSYRTNMQAQISTGFVPTMGALHEGHLSLVSKSIENNDCTIVSIFVNPTQFNQQSDLQNYPNTLQQDLEQLEKAGVDIVVLPEFSEMYPDNYRYKVTENELSQKYCGKHRPGHFDGVLTVVMKLLNLVNAENAYFGEKDYQQLTLIRGMTEAFFMKTRIVACPLIREKDGLAMSSRNLRLTKEQRQTAPALYRIISSDMSLESMKTELQKAGFTVDYLEIMDNRLLAAATLGEIRLIDNVPCKSLRKAV